MSLPSSESSTAPVKLIWTRAAADIPGDLQRLGCQEYELAFLPCLKLTALPIPTVVQDTGAVVFTSAHGVQFASEDGKFWPVVANAPRVFAVGAATASALHRLGLKNVVEGDSAQGAEGLGPALLKEIPRGATVILAVAKDPAFALADMLADGGLKIQRLALYETAAGITDRRGQPLPPAEQWAALDLLTVSRCLVCFASPSAVRGLTAAFILAKKAIPSIWEAVVIGATTEKAVTPHFPIHHKARWATLEDLFLTAQQRLNIR